MEPILVLCQVQVLKLPSPLERPIQPSFVPCATWIQSALPSPFTSAKKGWLAFAAPTVVLCQVQVLKLPSPFESPTQASFVPCATWIQSALPSPFTSAKRCLLAFAEPMAVLCQVHVLKVPSPFERPTQASFEQHAT